jgi:multiple sugar transport system substrate-binding protein
VLEPLDFLRRLAALVSFPYSHQSRRHGIFANRSRFRRLLPPPPPSRYAEEAEGPPILHPAAAADVGDCRTTDAASWRAAMQAIRRRGGPDRYAIFLPINEWLVPVVLGLQAGSSLLAEDATRGAFRGPQFRQAFDFLLGLYRDGLAPPVSNNEIANMYQEFGRGYFAMQITGPWNLGEFRRRLPAELQDAWGTAPLPGPVPGVPGVSTAGGCSLVLFRESKHQDAACRLISYLSRPDVQLRFFELTGDLPARREAWTDPQLADPKVAAFGRQLQSVSPTPKIPEWELIATRVQERVELAVRGAATPDSALAMLDRDAEQILAKRRWMMEKHRNRAGSTERP